MTHTLNSFTRLIRPFFEKKKISEHFKQFIPQFGPGRQKGSPWHAGKIIGKKMWQMVPVKVPIWISMVTDV